MAAMTMTTPKGAKVRTRAAKKFALVVDEYSKGYPTGKGVCIFRTDNLKAAERTARSHRRNTGFKCFVYDTTKKSRLV